MSSYCLWTRDYFDDDWNTSCDSRFTILEGTPSQNDMRFCCYCGKALKEEVRVYVPEPTDAGGAA